MSKGPLDSNKYLIQFERKELGFEFCLDVEISSHGVKEVLLPANPRKMYGSQPRSHLSMTSTMVGELAYGSTYGTILNFNEDLTEEKLKNFYLGKGVAHVVSDQDKAVEKEILIKLMFMMDSSLKRKARILKTIEAFNRIINNCVKRSHKSAAALLNIPYNKSFREYYIWLKDSLSSTNYVIKKCITYMQIMYGHAYSSGIQSAISYRLADTCPSSNKSVVDKEKDNNYEMSWTNSLKTGSIDCGRSISDSIQVKRNKVNGGYEEKYPPCQNSHLQGCLAHASSLLLATELSRKSIWESRNDKIFSGAVIQSIFADARNSIQPTSFITDVPLLLAPITRARDQGFQALSEALAILEGELDILIQS